MSQAGFGERRENELVERCWRRPTATCTRHGYCAALAGFCVFLASLPYKGSGNPSPRGRSVRGRSAMRGEACAPVMPIIRPMILHRPGHVRYGRGTFRNIGNIGDIGNTASQQVSLRANCRYTASRDVATPTCHQAGSVILAWPSPQQNSGLGVLCRRNACVQLKRVILPRLQLYKNNLGFAPVAAQPADGVS